MKIKIKVVPNSSRDCVVGWLGDELKICVKATPEKGRANKAVVRVLAKELKLAQELIEITHGFESTRKIVQINAAVDELIRKS